MRIVLALVSLVLAIVLIGFGIAQRTILAGPDSLVGTSESTSDAPVTIVDGETLNALDGRQDVRVGGSDTIFAAYGRTDDVLAWVGDAAYNRIGFDAETQTLTTELERGAEQTVPNPAGSDLWLREYTGETTLDMKVSLTEDLSIIIVSDGENPAPASLSISWPLDNRTPWAGPLIAGGGAMLLLALFFFVWAIVHRRRTRGPRRKSIGQGRPPKMPRLPKQRTYRVRKPRAIAAGKGRRSIRGMTVAIPVVLVATLGLSACSSESWPDVGTIGASPSPSALDSADAAPQDEVRPPAATVGQVEAIVRDVSAVAQNADAELDATALETRFTGPALEHRRSNYAIRAKDSAYEALAGLPSGPVEISLPQSLPLDSDPWPRSIFAVVQSPDPATVAPWSLMLVQESPREQYKVYYAVRLGPDAVLPELAPRGVGTPRLGPDTKLLSLPPGELLAAYTDVVNVGTESASYELFDIERDKLLPQIGVDARAELTKALEEDNGVLEFTNAPGDAETIALASTESGALVSTYLTESTTATPASEGDTINPEGGTKTLTGVAGSTRGFTADYAYQLLFYVPPIGSTDKIVLLGFSEGLINASEIP